MDQGGGAHLASRAMRVAWPQGQLEPPHRRFGGAPQGWTVAVLDEGANTVHSRGPA